MGASVGQLNVTEFPATTFIMFPGGAGWLFAMAFKNNLFVPLAETEPTFSTNIFA